MEEWNWEEVHCRDRAIGKMEENRGSGNSLTRNADEREMRSSIE
jgi:hypothetical protein